jgi:DNA-binding beta-propeller fold protein YncE
VAATVPVGSHPSDMLELPKRNELLVACSDSDLVAVLDLEHLREVRRVNIQIPKSPLGGAQRDALAFDADTGRLFVAFAAVNAVAVFELGDA